MNWPTVIAAVLVAAVILSIVDAGIRGRKRGKGSCGCGCSGCAMKDSCHSKN